MTLSGYATIAISACLHAEPPLLSGPMASPIRVVLAEDHDDLRRTLRVLIADEPDLTPVADTPLLDDVIPLCQAHAADVVVLDLELQGKLTLKRLPQLREQLPDVRFVVFSGHAHPEMVKHALEAGASAYISKSSDSDELVHAIRQVMVDGGVPGAP